MAVFWAASHSQVLRDELLSALVGAASLWVLSTTALRSSSGESTLDRSMLEDERPGGWSS